MFLPRFANVAGQGLGLRLHVMFNCRNRNIYTELNCKTGLLDIFV